MKKNFFQLDQIKKVELFPGFNAKMVHTPFATVSYVWVDKGAVLPMHQHPEEQILNLIKGEMIVTVGRVTSECLPGAVVVIPPNQPHTVTAISECLAIDVFAPPRKDYHAFGKMVE